MCGRYTIYDVNEIGDRFKVEVNEKIRPNYNVAPTHVMPVITQSGLKMMKWGLIPSWAKDKRLGYALFNARSETVFDKPIWKGIIKRNRCLIPANGFYEWRKTSEVKEPNYIHLPDSELFAFAGVWDTWINGDTEWNTYSILTTEPNKEMMRIHDRMPVILNKEDEDTWLHEDTEEIITSLLKPLPDYILQMHPVSKDVNTVKVNSKTLILPINSA